MRIPGYWRWQNYHLRRKILKSSRALILAYHRIYNLKHDWQQLSVTPENFESHLQIIKDKFKPISVDELIDNLFNDKVSDRSIALTFDDGYFDNYKFALPLLEKYEIPATVYVSTGFIGGEVEFYWDSLEHSFTNKKKQDASPNIPQEYYSVCDLLHTMTIEQRLEYLEMKKVSFRKSHRQMTKEEIIVSDSSPFFQVQAHTVNHPSLSALSLIDQEYEISQSQSDLKKILNREITGFAYPYGGKNDFNEKTKKIVRKLGFKYAMANYSCPLWNGSDRYALTRFIVRNWGRQQMLEQLEKWYACEGLVSS